MDSPSSAAEIRKSAGETTGALRGTGGGCPADSAPTSSAATVTDEEREWILALGGYEDAVRSAAAYVKKVEGAEEDWPVWVDDLDALADDLRDGTAETKEQLHAAK